MQHAMKLGRQMLEQLLLFVIAVGLLGAVALFQLQIHRVGVILEEVDVASPPPKPPHKRNTVVVPTILGSEAVREWKNLGRNLPLIL